MKKNNLYTVTFDINVFTTPKKHVNILKELEERLQVNELEEIKI